MGDSLQNDDDDGKSHPVSSSYSQNYCCGILPQKPYLGRISPGTIRCLASDNPKLVFLQNTRYNTDKFQAHPQGGLILS